MKKKNNNPKKKVAISLRALELWRVAEIFFFLVVFFLTPRRWHLI